MPQAALLALQGLRDKGLLKAGQRVLINGAGGGASTFALQLAKLFGAEVTGVDSTEKLVIMSSTGAAHVIDCTKADFTKNGQTYDLILDFALHRSVFDCSRALTPEGRYVLVGGATGRILQVLFVGTLLSLTSRKKMGLLLHQANSGLEFIKELVQEGKIVPVIDRSYGISELAQALRYFGTGHAKGKLVIKIVENS